MKTLATLNLKIVMVVFWPLIIILFLPSFVFSEETYIFERMWPTLQQPWYFDGLSGIAIDAAGNVYVANWFSDSIMQLTPDGQFTTRWGGYGYGDGELRQPQGVAVDSSGYVYVVEWGNDRVQKFSPDGQFVATWGSEGSGDGQFRFPEDIAIDGSGYVYIADKSNHRIQKFTSNGQFVTKWGSAGFGDGQFSNPRGIAIDSKNNVYVADTSNHRIQKFTSGGRFITKWGIDGSGEGEFRLPYDIAVDSVGNVFVIDKITNRIQKFTSDGTFVAMWGNSGDGDDQFRWAEDLAVDPIGNVFAADSYNNRIQKFSSSGEFITKWGSAGSGNGKFNMPQGIVADISGNVYVVDSRGNRVQKFSSEGLYITQWGGRGSGDGEFSILAGIAIDNSGYVYVVEWGNCRVQKFMSDGQFISKWGSEGTGDGQFYDPEGITVNRSGNVYVADTGNHRIQKFTSFGKFITKWGSFGTGDGQFDEPMGIAVDDGGNVYVADRWNDRIQKFTSEGRFIKKWGSYGSEDGEFVGPEDVFVDASGYIYVADYGNGRIQKFTLDGDFVTKWGSEGNNPGELYNPEGVTALPGGKIYVSDTFNHRIQVFKNVAITSNNKAIIVAGGGPFAGNHLWDATQMCANFAYRALTYQGFAKESIYYLTSDIDLDLDNNGVLDDVDGDATNSNLQQAITSWASDADSLVLYLVDHGGDSTFRMSSAETLSASDLDIWLDQLQQTITGKVIVIYDACESGSFLTALMAASGRERIIITSTSGGESAYFVTRGSVSFSNFFWTHIFNGINVKDAFELSRQAISHTTGYQHPLLDADSDGEGNEAEDLALVQDTYIGNGTVIHGNKPAIGAVSPAQTISGTNSALLFADDVTDEDGIARVWAVIRPPDYNQGSSDNPVQELPSIDLTPTDDDRYEATYDNFNMAGTYQIAIYTRDRIGNTSIPELTTVSVVNPLKRKAIIVVGALLSDEIWTTVERNVKLSYQALSFQGYTDDELYLLSPSSIPGVNKLPVLSTLSNLAYALSTWALNNTQDVVLSLIGNGVSGSFQINSTETIAAPVLDGWLDSLQSNIPGKVTVIYDACQSGSFLSFLKPPVDKKWILLTSTADNQPACFLSDGAISFSKFFWTRVANGANAWDAFLHAKQAIEFTTSLLQGGEVVAQLDDNGNGLGNEKSDGRLARNYTIGVGIMLAGDDPLIGSISPEQTISAGGSATIWVDDVTTTGSIDKVWALIIPPGYQTGTASDPVTDLPVFDLRAAGNYRYEGTFSDFTTSGTYQATAYAMDAEGNISMPKDTRVCLEVCSDDYENDDSFNTAKVIVINAESARWHNFHDLGDQDWVKFYAVAGETYTIKVSNAGSNCDAVIELYSTNGTSRITEKDDMGPGETEELSCACQQDGIYFVKIRQYDANVHGENTGYDLKVYRPIGPLAGFVRGTVLDGQSQEALANARIKTSEKQTAISLTDGNYLMVHPPGTVPITAQMDGYISATHTVTVSEGDSVTQNFILTSVDADSDGDGVNDDMDNCPDISNADQSNNDNDRMGDVCDPDDDNDGMPDEWETAYGLNPLVDDAREDNDWDGFSNIREYRRGTDPNDPQDFPEGRAMPWIPILLLDNK